MAEPARVIAFPGRRRTRRPILDPATTADEWDELARLRGYADMGTMMLALVQRVLRYADSDTGVPEHVRSAELRGLAYDEPTRSGDRA